MEYTFFDWVQLVLTNYSGMILKGTGYTILLAIVGTGVGFLIGLLIGIYKTLPIRDEDPMLKKIVYKVFNFLLSTYIEVFRSTPMMVQACVIFYGFAYMTGLRLNVTTAAMIIISINTGAYMAEIVRSGIQSVDKGQNEGARSIGMTDMQAMFYVILPQAIKNAFPSIGNEFVVNIKDSCVLNCIGFAELFFQAKSIQGSVFDYTGPFLVVGIMYFVLTFTTTRILGIIEEKMNHTHSSIPASDTTANSIQRGGF